ncbi:MAG: NUDIX domain-containing protein [Chitinophagaceae bacterium]
MKQIIIRVYGIWIDENARVLLSDERIGNREFTKFPGGGLEPGEGTHDALRREWMEELEAPIDIIKHVYTTDFFQASAFHENTQIISIYYRVEPTETPKVPIYNEHQPFKNEGDREEIFRWVYLDDLKEDMLTFPIDKKIANFLLSKY